jgi:hypothetical protein
VAITTSYRGKSPARREKRDILYNILVARVVNLLPVDGSGKEEHGLGLKPRSFWPERRVPLGRCTAREPCIVI